MIDIKKEYAAGRRDFRNLDLSGADLRGIDLTNTNLAGVNLTNANLASANLIGADLVGADLTDANLTGANLNFADLTDASLDGANLTNTNLAGANLTDADLSDIITTGTNFHEAVGFRFAGSPEPVALRCQVATHIEAHPELHDQTEWGDGKAAPECNTPCCVAGWACHFGGGCRNQTVPSAAFRLLWAEGKPMPSFCGSASRKEILEALRA